YGCGSRFGLQAKGKGRPAGPPRFDLYQVEREEVGLPPHHLPDLLEECLLLLLVHLSELAGGEDHSVFDGQVDQVLLSHLLAHWLSLRPQYSRRQVYI